MPTPSPDPLSNIDHVVVLMLENRSFDNILGHLYGLPEGGQNTLIKPSGEHQTINSWSEPGTTFPQMTIPAPDPGEAFIDMNQQIFGLPARPTTEDPLPTKHGELKCMGGFAQNYSLILASGEKGDPKDISDTPVRNIMHFFDADQVPVSTQLANSFRVVDTYHAAAPCQTMPNRIFAQLGTANGFVNNSSAKGKLHAPYFGPSIFGQIREAQKAGEAVDWRCYFSDAPLTLAVLDTWEQFDKGHFRSFEQFAADVCAGDLPAYTWLEPAYQIAPNDNHPPHDVTRGEALLATVYNTLRASSLWPKTLFILTYDEHGGCYDRVMPGSATPPGGPYPDGFNFDRYGVRVPCILMSDYSIDPGRGESTETVFDHTSILAMLRKRWSLGEPLSDREANAYPLSDLLGPARSGAPENIPVPQPVPAVTALEQQAETDAAALVAAKLAGASKSELKAMFINNLKETSEQMELDVLDPYLEKLLEALDDIIIPHGDLFGWLAEAGAKVLHLLAHLFDFKRGRLRANDLGELAGWIVDCHAALADEHRQTPLTPERMEQYKAQASGLEDYDRQSADTALRRFQGLVAENT